MSTVNRITLIGNLGKDPEIKEIANGKKVANFSLATSEKSGETTHTDWHNITLWEKQAEIAEKYLKKGSKIYLEGKVRYETYDDKDGVKKYVTKIVGHSFTMLDSKPSNGETTPASKAETSAENYMNKGPKVDEAKTASKTPEKEVVSDVYTSFADSDDLPF